MTINDREQVFEDKKLTPIFIIGLPRSGSKLTRGLLNNHNDIYIQNAESNFIPYFIRKYGKSPNFHSIKNRNKIVKDLNKSTYFQNLHVELFKNEDFSEILKSNSWPLIFKYLLNEIANPEKDNRFFGDKTPGYMSKIELISGLFSNAKFIHIIRDPRDQVLSSRSLWGKNIYRSAQSWRDNIKKVRIDVLNNMNIEYIEIKYEELLKDTEVVINNLCKFLDCTFCPKMLELNVATEGKGVHSKKTTISHHNSDKFYTLLTKKEIKRIEELTLDVLIDLGYPLTNKDVTIKRLNNIENFIYRFIDMYKLTLFHIFDKGFLKGLRYLYYFNKYKS